MLTSILALAAPQPPELTHSRREFDLWTSRHGKKYETTVEAELRFDIFHSNRAFINAHNLRAKAGLHSFTTALNQFADITNDEYRETVLGLKRRRVSKSYATTTFRGDGAPAAPDSFDSRPLGVVNDVKDQGQCGSCWAFSAVAAMEGAFNKKHNGSMPSVCTSVCGPNRNPCCSFSEQELVDCTLGGADNCDQGGEMHDGMMEIVTDQNGKINTEAQYPYTSGGGTSAGVCHAKPAHAVASGITGYANVTVGNETALKLAAHQHLIISVAIDASQQSFQFYEQGVYDEPHCHSKADQLDHGVAVVGYGYLSGPSPGPSPPGPTPGPHPADCPNHLSKSDCGTESGCHWCADPLFPSEGFCFSFACPPAHQHTQMVEEARRAAAQPKGTAYWLVRNSWAGTWGMDGYIMMSRDKNNQCGIASDATFALTE